MAIAERRETVVYLRELSSLLNQVSDTRRAWVHQLSPLLRDAERRDPLTIARSALRALKPPVECMSCHAAALSWLDEHVVACERLIRAGETRDVRRLRAAQEPLADARACAERVTSEYARLVEDLRREIPRRSPSFWDRLRRSPN